MPVTFVPPGPTLLGGCAALRARGGITTKTASSFVAPRFAKRARVSTVNVPTPLASQNPRMALGSAEGSDKILEGPIPGKYGEWYLKQSDANGVFVYRVAVASMSLCMSAVAALAVTKGSDVPPYVYDALYFVNLASFGVALQTIHIYMKPLHNALKALWGLGLAASVALSLSPLLSGNGIVMETYNHPALLLAIGWQFVALTGLFIKEAACFGRFEAISLIFLIPFLAGGHFIGFLPASVETYGAIGFAAFFLLFSARKFMQPAKDDIGDMSVFEHLAKGGTL